MASAALLSKLLVRSLRARWLEHLLAAAVVAAAVAAVTTVRSITASAEKQVHELAHNLGRNMLVIPAESDLAGFYAFRYGDGGMPDSYPEKLRSSGLGRHIRAIQARLYGNVESNGVPLILVGQKVYSRGYPGVSRPPGEAILGHSASARLGLGKSDSLLIGESRLTVTDVIRRPPDGLDTGVFTSLRTSQEITGRTGKINAMRLAGCWCKIDVPTLASKVERLLPRTRAVTVAGVIKAQKGTISVAKRYSAAIHAAAVLLVAGIVITLTASQVRREKREIGLLMAVGTPPRLVALLFIIKAGLVGAAGAVAGCLLGIFITENAAAALVEAFSATPGRETPFLIVALFSICVSVVSALFPAMEAARLDPVEALRET